MVATAEGVITALQLSASEPASESDRPTPVDTPAQSTSPQLPPITTAKATVQPEPTTQGNGDGDAAANPSKPLACPVPLDDAEDDETLSEVRPHWTSPHQHSCPPSMMVVLPHVNASILLSIDCGAL